MAWEWVTPTAAAASGLGAVFFTYLAGTQSRKQSEGLAKRIDDQKALERIYVERREAYLAALRIVSLEIRRQRYEHDGELERLEQVDREWPRPERIRMSIEAQIAVEAFGSPEATAMIEPIAEAIRRSDWQETTALYRETTELFRKELAAMGFSTAADAAKSRISG